MHCLQAAYYQRVTTNCSAQENLACISKICVSEIFSPIQIIDKDKLYEIKSRFIKV